MRLRLQLISEHATAPAATSSDAMGLLIRLSGDMKGCIAIDAGHYAMHYDAAAMPSF